MKKLVTILCFMMIFSALVSCGSQTSSTNNDIKTTKTQTEDEANTKKIIQDTGDKAKQLAENPKNVTTDWVEKIVRLCGENDNHEYRIISFSIPKDWESREIDSPISDATGRILISNDYLSNDFKNNVFDNKSVALGIDSPEMLSHYIRTSEINNNNQVKYGANHFIEIKNSHTINFDSSKKEYLWLIERDVACQVHVFNWPSKFALNDLSKIFESLRVIK